jgi:glycosyltransferase involved in cell wall biosynthesis
MSGDRHVVHMVAHPGVGGIQVFVENLVRYMDSTRYRHTVVLLRDKRGPMVSRWRDAGASVLFCPVQLLRWVRPWRVRRWTMDATALTFPFRFAWMLRAVGAHLVHTHHVLRVDLQAFAITQLARLSWVWTAHGRRDTSGRTLEVDRRAAHLAQSSTARITAVSEATARWFAETMLVPVQEIRVAPGGVDLKRYKPRQDVPRSGGWCRFCGATRIRFGALGRLGREKGFDVLLSGARLLLANYSGACFTIYGTGAEEQGLREEAKRLGIDAHVHWRGMTLDPADALLDFDVFVMPSRTEGFPLALLEALACGLPCVASSVGGIPEILGEDGGIMVPPDDPQALADAMLKMMDPEVRRHYSALAPEIAKRFSIEECARKYAEIYEELLAGRGR